MASYKKYAEDLVGNWETGQYEPQRETIQNVYQTNWNKLINDYNTLKDKLARNFSNAQINYANTLGDVQNESFNRMRNANIDLANRGLSTSGVGNLVTQADTQRKGEDVDKALASLLATNNASIEGLTKGVTSLGQQESNLASDLAGDLGGITKAETSNAQQYANLLAGIGETARKRDLSKAGSKSQDEINELKRRMLIADTLESEDMTDDEKSKYLTIYLDVPAETAKQAVTAYANNKLIDTNKEKILNNINFMTKYLTSMGQNLPGNLIGTIKQNQINRAQNEIKDKTYEDLYKILYGNK